MSKSLSFAFMFFVLGFGPAGHAEVYELIGPDGKVTYTDSPSEGGNSTKVEVVKIDSYAGPAEVSSVGDSTASRKATIFTTEWCDVCRKAKLYMTGHGIAYDELDIEKSQSARTKFDRLGGRAVPVILIGKEKMTGFSPAKFEAMLIDAGIGPSNSSVSINRRQTCPDECRQIRIGIFFPPVLAAFTGFEISFD